MRRCRVVAMSAMGGKRTLVLSIRHGCKGHVAHERCKAHTVNMRAPLLVFLALLATGCVPANVAVNADSYAHTFNWLGSMANRSVLFVGAHPDDEWGVAPLLADACIDQGARCHFVVTSESKSYGCLPTIGLRDPFKCSQIRREEMQQAAALFGGSVEFFGWEDLFYSFSNVGVDRTLAGWANAAGGHEALVQRFERMLKEQKPDVIFTLDPRHGSTCHPSHRATAMLLLEAIKRLPMSERPIVWLEQTDNIDERSEEVERVNAQLGYIGWPDTAADTVWFDATKRFRSGSTGYDYMLAARRLHKSQFPDEASGKTKSSAPSDAKRVPLAPLTSYQSADYCSALHLDRPTLDIPENRKRFGIDPS
ncbi:MAG: PIG-L family deacetylase [Sphingomicrobium sp.]